MGLKSEYRRKLLPAIVLVNSLTELCGIVRTVPGLMEHFMPVTVLLADDSDVLRNAILGLLKQSAEVEVVGQTSNFSDTVALARQFKPQVTLIDLHMLRQAPLDRLQDLSRESSVVAMSLATGEEAQRLAESIGAKVVLDKIYLSEELIPAILKVARA